MIMPDKTIYEGIWGGKHMNGLFKISQGEFYQCFAKFKNGTLVDYVLESEWEAQMKK